MEINTFNLEAGDASLWEATATEGGFTGIATSRDESQAVKNAIQACKAKQAQNLVNWENTPEAKLAEVKIWEVCPDYTGIGELSRDFAG